VPRLASRRAAQFLEGVEQPSRLLDGCRRQRQRRQREAHFDREFATMFSARPKEPGDAGGEGVDPEEFQEYFMCRGTDLRAFQPRYYRRK
jgi:phenol 2-monooxygenase (NADPH)